ncbi:Pc12g00370 [Penicillium rubens Wisconsin 54-1255]|uniref:Pc12g00370 protein n=1 Tax=Penicillium rubens (strain ATCC 28089 / DSM 1075 / NRRL 1951 / Wisconsin 54-1255) TaxID=500485 RepID=B6GXI3_PENRW|nr:Pc12g00370 [Penicillium rubens Wisconsin 54-1255]
MTFDLIISTASSFQDFPLSQYLSLLGVHGRFHLVGVPGGDGLKVSTFDFIGNGCSIGASNLGGRREVLEMLDLAATKGVKSCVKEVPISKEGIQTAIKQLETSSVRYAGLHIILVTYAYASRYLTDLAHFSSFTKPVGDAVPSHVYTSSRLIPTSNPSERKWMILTISGIQSQSGNGSFWFSV